MYKFLIPVLLFLHITAFSQPASYTTANAHSHNDYEQPVPLLSAWYEQFGSIEADIFWHNGELLVAHTKEELALQRTLEDLYLKPIQAFIQKNNGHVYTDSTRRLQLMIDIKTDSVTTLNQLIELLQKYPVLTQCSTLQIAISGNRPDPSTYTTYPSFIWFDGELSKEYSGAALSRIVMMSDDLKKYTKWNGKGNITAPELSVLQKLVKRSHALHKPVRFWAAPDFTNAWYQLMHLQVDYINTDSIKAIADFLKKLPADSYKSNNSSYKLYQPTYRSDGSDKPVKNILLFIGDGTGLTQLYAGYTANKGALNVFNMRNIGLSKTSSYDNYVTDSAPGSTSISSGQKTNNRHVGVDHTGVAMPLLPSFLKTKKIKTGLVTCGDITDATPADFYAHQPERENSLAILHDLKRSSIDLVMGSGNKSLSNVALLSSGKEQMNIDIAKELSPEYTVVSQIDSVQNNGQKKWAVVDNKAGLSMLKGRGNWLEQAFSKAVKVLSQNKEGFFLMTEGAQIDYGGHANNMPYTVAEVMDFDQVIGKALEFADKDGQTLVIVTADHETGGLSLLDGDYTQGYVSGHFATNDHTAVPVPVFAYGPQSFRFRGVYENTELFFKIMKTLGIEVKK